MDNLRSWKWIGVLSCVLGGWMVENSVDPNAIDPYPFSYLDLGLIGGVALQESLALNLQAYRIDTTEKDIQEAFKLNVRTLLMLIRSLEEI